MPANMESRVVRLEADYQHIGERVASIDNRVDDIHKILKNGMSEQIRSNTAFRKSRQKFEWVVITTMVGILLSGMVAGAVWIIRSMA